MSSTAASPSIEQQLQEQWNDALGRLRNKHWFQSDWDIASFAIFFAFIVFTIRNFITMYHTTRGRINLEPWFWAPELWMEGDPIYCLCRAIDLNRTNSLVQLEKKGLILVLIILVLIRCFCCCCCDCDSQVDRRKYKQKVGVENLGMEP